MIQYLFADDWDLNKIKTSLLEYNVESFSDGFVIPWGMTFLPDGSLIVNDISGKMYKLSSDGKKKIMISGVPNIFYKGQGGLLDVEVHPDFENNNVIYISYSDLVGNTSFTAIARAKLMEDQLINLETIYKADEIYYSKSNYHFGSRIVLDNKYLYFSIGDRGEREDAQDLNLPNGKIHRLFLNGDVPPDNPFMNNSGDKSSIWCYGNRNPQGLTIGKNGTLWELEHGPKGGDELNIIKKGNNYGWPIITYGINYNGTIISDYTHMDGMEQPVWHWTPSIAVCGMKIYEGDKFYQWNGNILVTSLKFEYLERVVIENNKRISSEIIYKPGSRVRDVEVGPNGNIYVALEDPGRIVKLLPVIN
jgi:glucose/arabinose dehydrogenase